MRPLTSRLLIRNSFLSPLRERASQLLRFDWLLLILLSPVFFYADRLSLKLVALALLPLIVVPLLRLWVRGQSAPRTPLDWSIGAFLLLAPVSLWASADPTNSFVRLAAVFFGISVYYAAVHYAADEHTFPVVLLVWLACSLVVSLLAVVSVDWVAVKLPLLGGITSRLPHLFNGIGTDPTRGLNPNVIGGTLALFVPPLASILWLWSATRAGAGLTTPANRWRRIRSWLNPDARVLQALWWAALLLAAVLLLLSQSRSALFGVTLSLLLLAVVMGGKSRRLAIGLIIVAGAVLIVIGPGNALGYVAGSGIANGFGSLDVTAREEVWTRALYIIQDFPFTGVGLGQFENVVRVLYPYFSIAPDVEVSHAHDIYLEMAVDFGLGGLVAYAALLMGTLLMILRAVRTLANSQLRVLTLAFAAGLLAYQIFGLTDAIVLGSRPSVVWWLTLGIISGIYLRAPALAMSRRVSAADVAISALLASLLAIAFVGDSAPLGIALALAGGCVFGTLAFMQFMQQDRTSDTPRS